MEAGLSGGPHGGRHDLRPLYLDADSDRRRGRLLWREAVLERRQARVPARTSRNRWGRRSSPASDPRSADAQQIKLIINADDLGISASVNDAIYNLMRQGRVTSATVLANGPAVEDAVERHAEFPHCSFGVHLNVSEFRPLTASPDLIRLLGSDGSFASYRVRKVELDPRIRRAVYSEWAAQIGRLITMGLRPSHIDSHHHVHTFFALLPVLKRLQRKFAIRKVRIRKNLRSGAVTPSPALVARTYLWNRAISILPRTVTTDLFASARDFHAYVARNGQAAIRAGSAELMVHPGNPQYEADTQVLARSWSEVLDPAPQLISYDLL